MKLPEDDPNYGPKYEAVIKQNQCKLLDWFNFELFVVLKARVSQIMTHNRMQIIKNVRQFSALYGQINIRNISEVDHLHRR
jgi:hypothetical protein